MRGLRTPKILPTPLAGITPAYAGTTKPEDIIAKNKEDHPCICGDY